MLLRTIVLFIFHFSAFIGAAFVSALVVVPFIGVAFILSSMTVALSFISRFFFEVAIFFYDQFVHFLQVELRNMVELLPVGPASSNGGRAVAAEKFEKEEIINVGENGDIGGKKNKRSNSVALGAFRPFSGTSIRSQFTQEVLGSTVPLQSIREAGDI